VKKILFISWIFTLLQTTFAAVPTEEGLLKNLNNPTPNGKIVTIKMAIQHATKNEFLKIVFLLDKPNVIGLAQITYSDSQMQPSQIIDVKFVSDLPTALAKETVPEKNLFYATLLMLATNRPIGMEIFLEKNGVRITKNKSLMNEDKMNLLKSYRTYLTNNKGKGELESPLNPTDAEAKAKIITLFKSNTYGKSKNIELVKTGSQFFWKADWQSLQAIFTNEERRLKRLEYKNLEAEYSLEANDYTSFNGQNELPKLIEIKNNKGMESKIQILGEVVNSKREFDDLKMKVLPKKDPKDILSFLY
jgi:hypothetical protein